jgi:hypothetical protein
MIVIEERPELEIHSGNENELRVERTDISFQDLSGDRVRILVTVHNDGACRSEPTFVGLESAPFGAFVPWKPLAVLAVPALEPGESRELRTEVKRPRPVALGDFDRVPPMKMLTAVNSPDQPTPRPGAGFMALLELLRGRQRARIAPRGFKVPGTPLAPDLWDIVGREQPHWAGNINVFIGTQPVERHLAKALRVYPGRANLAMFIVGGPRNRDAFAFDLMRSLPDWDAALYDVTNNRTLLVDSSNAPIKEKHWVESTAGLMVMLVTRPPIGCRTGDIEVRVTRRSSGKTAVVEFNLDPNSQGTGCYAV